MLNSKMKRSMAWIMTAAVVMSAAPVSAADFSSEEVTAEAAESEDSVVSEENTDAVDESAEDDFASVDMAEDDADSADVAVEEESTDDAEEAFISDGSEAENAEAEDVVDDGSMTAEELVATYAGADATDVEAPYSGVESLPAGTYENVTANVYVPGSLNSVLGLTAYMTNPNDPFGTGGSNKKGMIGLPTTPVYQNATLVIGEDGKKTLTVDLVNNVFMLLAIGKGDGATVTEAVHAGKDMASNQYIDGVYDGRITKLTIDLDNLSGVYTFEDCVEFGAALYQGTDEPDKDYKWYVPISLAVDFAPLTKASYTNVLVNDEQGVGLKVTSSNPDVMDAELKVEKITSGEEYEQAKNAVTDLCIKTPNFVFYDIELEKNGKKVELDSIDRASILLNPTSGSCWYSAYTCEFNEGKLNHIADGNVTTEYASLGELWAAAGIVDGAKLGKLVMFDATEQDAGLKIQKKFSDSLSGVDAIFYSADSVSGYYNQVSLNTKVTFKVKNGLEDSEVEQSIKNALEQAETGYTKVKIGSIYTMFFEYGQLYLKGSKGKTAMDVLLPDKEIVGGNGKVYYVNIAKDTGEVTLTEMETVKDESGKEKMVAFDRTDGGGKILRALYAGYQNNATTSYGRGYYVVVSEGAVEKPTAPKSEFTYDGTEKTVVPASDYYTIEGTPSAKLPGSYKVTVTLKDGYAWKDGTTDPIEFTWNIKALQTAKPAAVTGLTYNGQNQTGVKAGTGYNLAGTYTAKNVGSYKAKVLLAEGYEWSDGTTDPLTLTWSISKADQTVNTKVATKSYKFTSLKKKAASFTIGASGQGIVTYKVVKTPSKASKYITVDKNGKVTLKKGAKVGTYTISVIAAGNENYNAGSKDVTIKVNKLTQKITAKVSKKTVKASSVKKKAKTFNIGAKAKTTVSYKVVKTPDKAKKYISVSKKGKVTIKKKAPKGTYEIKVTAKANGTYNAATRTIKVVVK